MDFKVTGTVDGITACQMDIKIKGLRFDIMTQALNQARDGRLHILNSLVETISSPNEDVKAHAPKMITRRIPNEYIGALIGPGGKVIQELQKESDTTIVINEKDEASKVGIDLSYDQEKAEFENNLKTFQIVIFSNEKHKTGHLLNLPNYLIGATVRSKIERTEMILPGNTIHVDMRGMVMVTEDFMVLTKF